MLPYVKLSIIDQIGQSPILRKVLQRGMRKGEAVEVEIEVGDGSDVTEATCCYTASR